MADVPSCAPVCARIFAKHHATDLQRANAFLRGQHHVANAKPDNERYFGVLKNRRCGDAESIAFAPAAIGIAASPAKGLLELVNALVSSATRAFHDAVRPTLAPLIPRDFSARSEFLVATGWF